MLRAQRILAIAASVALLCLPAWAASFTDLPANTPRGILAIMLSERGILPGVSDTEYGGTTPLSRYELATVLNALLDPKDVASNIVAWSDIPPGHPSMSAVNNVTSQGLMEGVNGRFLGLRRVTRLEFVTTLVHLLNYRLVSAPPRRVGPALSFSDVGASSEAGKTLDRAANFWQIVSAPRRSRFRPNAYITRFEALDFLVRVLMLTDPSLEAPIRAALAIAPSPTPEPTEAPTPEAKHAPIETPVPDLTPVPRATPAPTERPVRQSSVTPTPMPTPRRPFWDTTSSPSPTPQPLASAAIDSTKPPIDHPVVTPLVGPDELLTTRGRLGLDAVLAYTSGGLQANVPGFANLDVSGQYWLGELGGSAQVSTIYPIALASDGSQYFDLNLHAEGLYKLPFRGEDWQAAAGAGALLHAMSGTGNASLTAFGLGPASQLAYHLMPGLALDGALQLYPVYVQSAATKTGLGVGSGWQLGVDYEVIRTGPNVFTVGLTYNGSLGLPFDGSSFATIQSLTVGAGGRF